MSVACATVTAELASAIVMTRRSVRTSCRRAGAPVKENIMDNLE
jgi:hypothetical protein